MMGLSKKALIMQPLCRALLCMATAGAAWLGAGCRTLEVPDGAAKDPDGAIALAATLPPDKEALANALALYSEGIIHENQGDEAAALASYRQAVAQDPANEELHLRMAQILWGQKENEAALRLLDDFTRSYPQSKRTHLWLALIYGAVGETNEVLNIYQRLITAIPNDPTGYLELAAYYNNEEEPEKAIALLRQAETKVDQPQIILQLLGNLCLQQAARATSEKEAQKRRAEARRVFEKLKELEPSDLAVLFQLGDLYILENDPEKAIECYERVEAAHPSNLQVKQKLALSFLIAGDKQKAIAMLEKIVKRRPDRANVHFYLGELYLDTGDKAKAEEYFRYAARAAPEDPAPFLKLALMKLESDPAGAGAILREGLQAQPGNAHLLEMLAYVQLGREEYASAYKSFQKAWAAAGALTNLLSANFPFNYAVAATETRHYQEAADWLNQAMNQKPIYLDAFLQYYLQRPADARRPALPTLEKLAAISAKPADVHFGMASIQTSLRQFAEAVASFEKAEKIGEEQALTTLLNSQFYFWYGAACERAGAAERAAALFKKSIQLDPENSEAYNYLAYMWAEKGERLKEAGQYIQKALALEPQNGAFLDTLGWIYFQQGQYREALRELQSAAQLVPNDATIQAHLGDTYEKLGDLTKAVEYWEKSFLADPEQKAVALKLEKLGQDIEALRKQAEKLRVADATNQVSGFTLPETPALENALPASSE